MLPPGEARLKDCNTVHYDSDNMPSFPQQMNREPAAASDGTVVTVRHSGNAEVRTCRVMVRLAG